MTLGWTLLIAIVVLGTISVMIKDKEYDEWIKNKNK